jgi:hypothetical protein
MSSFRKGHQYSNELAEVLVTTQPVASTGWTTTAQTFNIVPTVAGKRFRVLEVGYTVTAAGTNALDADAFDFGIIGSTSAFVDAGGIPADPALGTTISTSRGNANALAFRDAGVGNVDADGYPFLNTGEVLVVTPTGNVANGPTVVFFARLAPEINRDVDV